MRPARRPDGVGRRLAGSSFLLSLGVVLCLAAGSRSATAQPQDWELRFDEGGLRVETRDVPGSEFKAFRGSVVVPAEPEAVLARLQAVEVYPDWFPDTLETRVLERVDGGWASYVRTGAPWPVKDRDAVYVSSLERGNSRIRIDVRADPDLAPEVDDAVRIREARGFWELRTVEGGTAVHWEFHVEPGGRIPSGLANARVVSTPRGALSALREHFSGGGHSR